jgi:hypothetical protein
MMNLTILSTYPPRECGIASFSKDLKDNLALWGQKVSIIAISDGNTSYDYPQEVIFEITEDKEDDYQIAAEFVNNADIDAAFIEHEYGIFGGDSGSYVINFSSNLEKPYILNTHTVLPDPEINQKTVLSNLGQKALAVICMTTGRFDDFCQKFCESCFSASVGSLDGKAIIFIYSEVHSLYYLQSIFISK